MGFPSGKIAVNLRCLAHPETGVQVYTREITRRMKGLRGIDPSSRLLSRGPAGHAWEQFVLPSRLRRGELLFSPANTGPLSVAAQVVTIHDLSALDHPEWFSRGFSAWYSHLVPRLARRSAGIITVSRFSKERIVSLGIDPARVEVIPNGVKRAFFEAGQVAGEILPGLPDRFFLAVSSIQPRKNLDGLLRAWVRVARESPGWQLVIAGGGDRVFARPRLGRIPDGVRFIGRIPRKDLPLLYSSATAVVVPSLYEGFGLPVLEAMASGTPVVSSNTTGLAEAAGDAAVLVDPSDPSSIAEGMISVAKDEGLRGELIARGRERAERFSWERAAKATEAVLGRFL